MMHSIGFMAALIAGVFEASSVGDAGPIVAGDPLEVMFTVAVLAGISGLSLYINRKRGDRHR